MKQSSSLLEADELFKKFPLIYGTRTFINLFTKVWRILSWAS